MEYPRVSASRGELHLSSSPSRVHPGLRPVEDPSPACVRVLLCCATRLVADRLQELLDGTESMRLWSPRAGGEADVMLYDGDWRTEPDARGPRALRQWRCPAVLLDTGGGVGPVGAALHGFLGYLPPETEPERLLLCLRRVAGGYPDAPPPHLVPLIRTLADPPLDEWDREILRHLALGRSQAQILRELPMSERTLQRRVTRLLETWDATDGHHLGAIAVALGLGWPWETRPHD